MPDDTYRIFGKPEAKKLMITPSLGAAMGKGAASGVTFGAADDSQNLARYRAAAQSYLEASGRHDCRIATGTLLARPQYEFFYTCEPQRPTRPQAKR
jgi:hypothetical protein